MGSSERLEYAVIGDTVNCASRLESIDKTRQDNLCRVLASCRTKLLVEGDAGTAPTLSQPLTWKPWGSLHVKGRQEPLEIWELMDSAPAVAVAAPNPGHPAGSGTFAPQA